MKKKQLKTAKKLSLDKFKIAEFKNLQVIKGGDGIHDKGDLTITPPTNSGQISN